MKPGSTHKRGDTRADPHERKTEKKSPSTTRSASPAFERNARRGARLEDIDVAAWNDSDPNGDWDFYRAEHGDGARTAATAARYAVHRFGELLREGMKVRAGKFNPDTKREFGVAVGEIGMTERLLLSNTKIRLKATNLLLKEVTAHWRATRKQGRRWFLLTFIGDEGNTLEYAPNLQIAAMRSKVDKLIRQAKLDAIVAIETQMLTNFPQRSLGGTLMVHGHAIAWTDDPGFDRKAVEAKLRASRRLSHSLGIPTVTIKPIEHTERDIRWCCYYILKAPYVGKIRVQSRNPGQQWQLQQHELRPAEVVRLAEGLLQLELPQVMFAVGGGNEIIRPWRRKLNEWHKKQVERFARPGLVLLSDHDISNLCDLLRRSNGQVARQPYRIDAEVSGYCSEAARDVLAQEREAHAASRRKGKPARSPERRMG